MRLETILGQAASAHPFQVTMAVLVCVTLIVVAVSDD
jgi:hypothetical protein